MKKISGFLFIIVMVTMLSVGCNATVVSSEKEIVVATYNILNGAGVETLFIENKEWMENQGYVGSRLQQVLDVVKYINPDILGIQEAHQWELGDPAVVAEVATQLGMNYFFGQSTNPDAGFCSAVLFTKFEIVEAENFPENFTRAGLRARLKTPEGKFINVFVAHLDPNYEEIRKMEVTFILEEMAVYNDEYSIIMGDMNFFDPGVESRMFYEANWQHPLWKIEGIDQIWVSPALEPYTRKWGSIPAELTEEASDHTPSVVIIGIP